MELFYSASISLSAMLVYCVMSITIVSVICIFKSNLRTHSRTSLAKNEKQIYEENEEYDYGHNVKRYHVDGEGEYLF